MINRLMRTVPLGAYRPLRGAVLGLPRRHPVRIASLIVLKRAAQAHRHALPARLTEVRPLDMPDLSFEPTDSMVIDALYWLGVRGYEGTVPQTWTDLCRQAQAVLEIGGNIGLFSVIGGRVTPGRYTVVEPLPGNAAILRANLRRNRLDAVEVVQAAAVSGESRTVRLNVPDEGRGAPVGAHLVEGSEVSGRSTKNYLDVDGISVRELAAGRDLIKIDAEGIEVLLLTDIRDQLLKHKPSLVVEVLPESRLLGKFLADLASEAGYVIRVLPEFGSDTPVVIAPASFSSLVPAQHNAKDVLLSSTP